VPAAILARFDLRAPDFGTPTNDVYGAFLDMAAFAEAHDFTAIALSEHHMSDDGFLPSPLVAAAAVAGRTSRIPITVAAILLPLHDPVQLAEDIAVLDHVSRGRVSYVVGIGYRPAEYDLFGVDFHRRGKIVEEQIDVLRRAWAGERFTYDGRDVSVRPLPYSQPHPMLFYGGATVAAARRAARLDLPFFPQLGDPALGDAYQQERARLGLEPGFSVLPGDGPLNTFVSEDPDATWERLAEHLLHDARTYAQWQLDAGLTSVALETATTLAELRAGGVYTVVTPEECVEIARSRGTLSLHPLCGGAPPEIGWETLELVAKRVMPALADAD
jgi:alkanesulfonate monooxygenase SsuD/methylene tetrahydromethanopterin reductase-like flavin-dependent oxidoreductase (luciferase family)